MWESIINSALANGIWAALFVGLFAYVLRDTAKREKNYQDLNRSNQTVITSLSDSLRVVKDIKTQTDELYKTLDKHCDETREIQIRKGVKK